jgi:hypothetical protein
MVGGIVAVLLWAFFWTWRVKQHFRKISQMTSVANQPTPLPLGAIQD